MSSSILIVDDEQAIRELCAAILSGYGYVCETASSGSDGVARFTSAGGAFDLILSDVLMPDFNGPEMVRRMEVIRPDIKSVFMSGFPDAVFPESKQKAAIMKKPFTAQQLVRVVQQSLA